MDGCSTAWQHAAVVQAAFRLRLAVVPCQQASAIGEECQRRQHASLLPQRGAQCTLHGWKACRCGRVSMAARMMWSAARLCDRNRAAVRVDVLAQTHMWLLDECQGYAGPGNGLQWAGQGDSGLAGVGARMGQEGL